MFFSFILRQYGPFWYTGNIHSFSSPTNQKFFHEVWGSYLISHEFYYGRIYDQLNQKPRLKIYTSHCQSSFYQLVPFPPFFLIKNNPPHLRNLVPIPTDVFCVLNDLNKDPESFIMTNTPHNPLFALSQYKRMVEEIFCSKILPLCSEENISRLNCVPISLDKDILVP